MTLLHLRRDLHGENPRLCRLSSDPGWIGPHKKASRASASAPLRKHPGSCATSTHSCSAKASFSRKQAPAGVPVPTQVWLFLPRPILTTSTVCRLRLSSHLRSRVEDTSFTAGVFGEGARYRDEAGQPCCDPVTSDSPLDLPIRRSRGGYGHYSDMQSM